MTDPYWLPVIFAGLMGLAILVYSILDGYDLGVGILLPIGKNDDANRDTMIASVGPFWDANETWLVLGIGLMLIAFPQAYSVVLYNLYIPVALMLIGLILRGVAFDFRVKAAVAHKLLWDRAFKYGSLITTLSQGYMLGLYVMGFNKALPSQLFCLLSALGVTAAYSYIGGAWLVMKTEHELQRRAIRWTRSAGRLGFIGVIAVSIVNPIVNPGVFDRWFDYPLVMFVLLIPTLCYLAFIANDFLLKQLPKQNDQYCWLPFVIVIFIFLCCFTGLVFSFFPDVVPGRLDIWQAASAPASLRFILVGALIVVPVILLYTIYAYRVFRGKSTELRYD